MHEMRETHSRMARIQRVRYGFHGHSVDSLSLKIIGQGSFKSASTSDFSCHIYVTSEF